MAEGSIGSNPAFKEWVEWRRSQRKNNEKKPSEKGVLEAKERVSPTQEELGVAHSIQCC